MPFSHRESDKLATKLATELTANARKDKTPQDAHDKSSSRSSGRAVRQAHRKPSEVIELGTASDVLAALIHADCVGRVPNRFTTINLQAAGIEDPIAVIGRLLKLIRDALRRHHPDFTYIWVRETGEVIGDHVHILFHLPPGREKWFWSHMRGWLKRCRIASGKRIVRTKVIRGAPRSSAIALTSTELFRENLRTVATYVLKHCSLDVQRALGIISAGANHVVGKRVSISENLHRAARSRCSHCSGHVPLSTP